MKVKNINLLLALMTAFLFSGCITARSPVIGAIYTDVTASADVATSNSGYSKEGSAQCTSFLGIVADGDCSISRAMQDGNISKIHHIDYKTKSILGYSKHTVKVYGE